ncbi:hypothetical protein Ae331Ps2_5948c [Pseudonocardia sp. Ae331_Ps2]|nr:hypothetical protein Ae331Ps2_5948c [Pseudonocardia sp. Ae331_Ps2]
MPDRGECRTREADPGEEDVAVPLTTALRTGTLATWCRQRLTGLDQVARDVARAAARAPQTTLSGPTPGADSQLVGGIVDARLAALVQPAPPYAALQGLLAGQLVSPGAAARIALSFPTHRELPDEVATVAHTLHPSPREWLQIPAPAATSTDPPWGDSVFPDLANRGHLFHHEHAPCGQVGTAGAERALARSYGVWALAEAAYRSGHSPRALSALAHRGPVTTETLRAAVPDGSAHEAAALVRALATSENLPTLLAWGAERPPEAAGIGYASPTLIPHFADADLLVGTTLLDVKVSAHAAQPRRVRAWLQQVLGYAWLDVSDRWGIQHVGLVLARQGLLVRWDLQSLTAAAFGDTDPLAGVQQFRRLCQTAAHAERKPPFPDDVFSP